MTFPTHKHCCRGQETWCRGERGVLICVYCSFVTVQGWPPAVVLHNTTHTSSTSHEIWSSSNIFFHPECKSFRKTKKRLSILREKDFMRTYSICTHSPDTSSYRPYLRLSPHLSSNERWTPLAFILAFLPMNSDLTTTSHLGRLTAELSVGDAQSSALRLKTTVPLQQQHLQRFGGVLTNRWNKS